MQASQNEWNESGRQSVTKRSNGRSLTIGADPVRPRSRVLWQQGCKQNAA